jgi:XTP/dITP diphosphohydrolase
VLVLAGPGSAEQVFMGRCDGRLLCEPRGGAGFGYDPLFVPDGYTESFAELGEAVKNSLSHRGRAWVQLAAWLEGQLR